MRRLGILGVAAALALAMAVPMAQAAHTPNTENPANGTHYSVHGNLRCGDIAAPGGLIAHDVKIDPPANGTYPLSNGGAVKIKNFDGTSFDWEIVDIHVVDAWVVLVKGGPYTEVYMYANNLVNSDYGLTAAVNAKNGKYYGVSHISFCFDKKGNAIPPPGAGG